MPSFFNYTLDTEALTDVRGRGVVRPERVSPSGTLVLPETEYLELILEAPGASVRLEFPDAQALARFLERLDGAARNALDLLALAKITEAATR